jgi:DNA-binding CsgD family transcriptional regulator
MWIQHPPPRLVTMKPRHHPEAIDTRLFFRAYAWITITAGLLVYGWPAALLPDARFLQPTPLARGRSHASRHSSSQRAVAAVRAVARGHTYIDPSAGSLRARLDAADELTPREIEVLRYVALGHSNKEIAAALDVGEETIKTHVGHVLGKLQVESRGQATAQALKRGLIAIEDLA